MMTVPVVVLMMTSVVVMAVVVISAVKVATPVIIVSALITSSIVISPAVVVSIPDKSEGKHVVEADTNRIDRRPETACRNDAGAQGDSCEGEEWKKGSGGFHRSSPTATMNSRSH